MGGALETLHHFLAFDFVSEVRDVDHGVAKIGRYLHLRDRDKPLADARVFDLALQKATNLLTEKLIYTNSATGHRVLQRLAVSALVGAFLVEEFDNVAFEVLVEIMEDYATFVACLYFANVILKTLEALTASLSDLLTLAYHSHFGATP